MIVVGLMLWCIGVIGSSQTPEEISKRLEKEAKLYEDAVRRNYAAHGLDYDREHGITR